MARKPKADSAETIERVLSAAREVLERDDLETISLRKVAREAGVSVGTVSYYFSSAEALWEACLHAHYERVQDFAQRYFQELDGGLSKRELLPGAVRAAYRFARRESTMLRLVMATSTRRGALTDRLREDRAALLRGLALRWSTPERAGERTLAFQTIIFACVRYACSSAEERIALTGTATEEAADEAIAAHLASVAGALLL